MPDESDSVDFNLKNFDKELYESVRDYVSEFGISMHHVNTIILKKGYQKLLDTKDLSMIKE